jgi:hypothetical protein
MPAAVTPNPSINLSTVTVHSLGSAWGHSAPQRRFASESQQDNQTWASDHGVLATWRNLQQRTMNLRAWLLIMGFQQLGDIFSNVLWTCAHGSWSWGFSNLEQSSATYYEFARMAPDHGVSAIWRYLQQRTMNLRAWLLIMGFQQLVGIFSISHTACRALINISGLGGNGRKTWWRKPRYYCNGHFTHTRARACVSLVTHCPETACCFRGAGWGRRNLRL